MINKEALTVVYVDLERLEVSKKNHLDYFSYIGGVGLAYKILEDNFERDPVILAIGPFSGIYPYISKTAICFLHNDTVKEYYIGGKLATSLKFAGVDAVVFLGHSKQKVNINISLDEYLVGGEETDFSLHPESTTLNVGEDKITIDDYFSVSGNLVYRKFVEKGIENIHIIGDSSVEIFDRNGYDEAYEDLMEMIDKIDVTPSTFSSCSGCPVGCEFSNKGEIGTSSYLSHCLVSCSFADKIYTDIATVYRCLSVLGYSYTHEHLEFVEGEIKEVRENIYEKIADSKL